MSITLDRLRALKRQAGGDVPAARSGGDRTRVPDATMRTDTGETPPAANAAKPPGATRIDIPPRTAAPGVRPGRGPNVAQASHPMQSDAPRATADSSDVDATDAAVPHGGSTARQALRMQADAACGDHRPVQCPGDMSGSTATRTLHSASPSRAASLDSLRRLLGVRERKPLRPLPPRAPLDRTLPGIEIAPGLHYIETRLPFTAPADALPLAFARRDTHVDPRALLFFDTETTGLAGGTGTRAFMIGAADWIDDTLRIRQLLMSTMAAETAMLREFATWLSPDTVLASYNGRSYDAPLLKTRYRLARLPDPLHPLDHLDLLHPTRRRYRGRWENCRLATIERELLRIVREDDLPGSQAPMAWLGFLRGGGSALLHRVCAHNHQDVVTLARLMLRLVEAQAAE